MKLEILFTFTVNNMAGTEAELQSNHKLLKQLIVLLTKVKAEVERSSGFQGWGKCQYKQ